MLGYTPQIELNTKDTFIELGVMEQHSDECDCEQCLTSKGGED